MAVVAEEFDQYVNDVALALYPEGEVRAWPAPHH